MLTNAKIAFFLFVFLSACGGANQRDTWRAIGQASCSLSMHCNPSSYAAGGTGYGSYNQSAPLRNAWDNGNGILDRKTGQSRVRGNLICYYSDGSAINVGGTGICPISI